MGGQVRLAGPSGKTAHIGEDDTLTIDLPLAEVKTLPALTAEMAETIGELDAEIVIENMLRSVQRIQLAKLFK